MLPRLISIYNNGYCVVQCLCASSHRRVQALVELLADLKKRTFQKSQLTSDELFGVSCNSNEHRRRS